MNKQDVIQWIENVLTYEEMLDDIDKHYKEYLMDYRPYKERNPTTIAIYTDDKLKKRLADLTEGKKRGFQTFIINYAINEFLDRFEEDLKKKY